MATCNEKYNIPTVNSPKEYAQQVYIDPTYNGTEEGTKDKPFNSWEDIVVETNTAYLIKSGTSLGTELRVEGSNIYIGKYGPGERPVISQFLLIKGDHITIDSINLVSYGNSQYAKAMDIAGADYVTIANSYITGKVGSYDYPYYLVRGAGEHITFYNNIMSGAKEDGLYLGSSPYISFIRNWIYDTNMGGVDKAYGGDGIQLEYDSYYYAYFAGNIIDRSNTMSKFCLILNGEDLTHDVTCIYNTFIAPKNGNSGAAVRWLGGDNTLFNKNLIVTYLEDDTSSKKVSGIATYDVSANQEAPYGIRDNHFLGFGNMFYGIANYANTNLKFETEAAYTDYLNTNNLMRYGSDIDTNDFWNTSQCGQTAADDHLFLEKEETHIYPNPVKNQLYIRNVTNAHTTYELRVVDITGRLVLQKQIKLSPNEVGTIDTSKMLSGIYLLSMKDVVNGKAILHKLVKQ